MVDSTNLPEVDINAIATDLNNKMDKDGVNATASVCVESWHEGTEWYRVYSDGWCEQGGFSSKTNASENITFQKSFIDTNYYINVVNYNGTSNYSFHAVISKSTTGSVINHSNQAMWEAKGYIR